MSRLSKFAAACAAVVCAFGAEARTISVGSGEDIATAIAGAQSGDVVELAALTFSPTAAIAIPDGVTVKGQGPDKTKIDGTSLTDRLFTLSSPETKLVGLSVVGMTTGSDGIAVKMTDGWVENCVFDQIWATKTSSSALPGGAISMTGGIVTNCTFTKCRGYGGGGVYLAGGLVAKCYFEGCRLNDFYQNMRAGAAVLVDGGTLRDCEVVRNYADCGWHSSGSTIGDWCGGAVSVFNDASVVERCLIASNELSSATKTSHSQWARVAGLSLKAGLVRNCVIVGNTNTKGGEAGKYGAGVYIRGGKFYHNTVVGNWVSGDGTHRSGILVDAGSPDIRNNIFAFNGPNGTEGGCNVQAGTFTHNIIDNPVDYAGASDNLLFDPLFLDRAKNDYRLSVRSLAIDAGADVAEVADDFLGAARPQGEAADLGAYEHTPDSEGVQIVVKASTDTIVEGDGISLSARYEGVASGTDVVVRWYLNDPGCTGASVGTGRTIELSQLASGAQTVTAALLTTAGAEPLAVGSFVVSVLPTTVYVDKAGGNVFPYNTAETAARSLDDGFAALAVKAGVCSTLHVAAGEYTATAARAYPSGLRLVGAGADRVTITGVGTRTSALVTCGGTSEISGVTFRKVVSTGAGGHGGALNLSAATVKDCVFDGCSATEGSADADGGGIYLGNGTVTNCVFTDCCARAGGGVFMNNGLVVDCRFERNRLYNWYTTDGGAAICVRGGTVRGCEIVGNRAQAGRYSGDDGYGGGAVTIYGDSAVVENCLIQGNVQAKDAGRSYGQYGRVAGVLVKRGVLRNSLVVANTNSLAGCAYPSGAGIYMKGGACYHNTVVGNVVVGDAYHRSGLLMAAGSPDARNNIFASNGPTGTEGGCCVEAGTFVDNLVDNDVVFAGASGNKKLAPQFVDAAAGDYRLKASSPAVDLGSAQVGAIAVDCRGVARPQGEKWDAGAYEYKPGEFGAVVAVLADAETFVEGDDVVVSTRIEGAPEGATVTVKWYLDGMYVGEGETYTVEQAACGQHTLEAKVFVNGEATPVASGSFVYRSLPTTVYVDANGGDVFPYATAETAARTLDDALSALAGKEDVVSTVHLAAGDYEMTSVRSYATRLKMTGAGAERTSITSRGDFVVPLLTFKSEVELRGITFKKVRTQGSGVIKMADGVVADCVFTGNVGGMNDPILGCLPGGAINMDGGLVTNCVFTGNSGYGGGAVAVYGGLVTGCRFEGNSLMNSYSNMRGGAAVLAMGGTVRNCEIVGNIANSGPYNTSWSGGGAVSVMGDDAVVDSCLIASNKLDNSQGYAQWGYVAGVNQTAGLVCNCVIRDNVNSNVTAGGNSVKSGAGVYIQGGSFHHNTVVGNYAQGDVTGRSGIMATSGSPDIRNNIFAFNGRTGTEGGCLVQAGQFVDNIVDMDVAYGTGNRKVDPLFVDRGNGDFRLQAMSLAVDLCDACGITADCRGKERPQGVNYDAGAFEYVPGEFGLVYGITAGAKTLKVGDDISLALTIDGLSPHDTFVCKWYCDDEEMQGEPAGDEESFVWHEPTPGTHAATVAFFVNGSESPTGTDTFVFDVLPFEVYVASDGGNVKPYDTPAKAARTFDDAWAGVWKAEGATTVVHVAAGTYTNGASYALKTPVRIVGADREAVRFVASADLNALNAPMFKVETNAVELSGFTVVGCTNSVDGAAVWLGGGVVRDCRFECNTCSANGAGVYVEEGLVTNCVFVGNRAHTGGGVFVANGLVVDCAFEGNVCSGSLSGRSGAAAYLAGGCLRRCEVVGNMVSDGQYNGFSGGAVMLDGANAVVENCVIARNQAKELRDNNAYFRSAGACMSAGVIRNCLISANTNSIAWRNDGYMTYLNGAGLVLTGGRAYNNTVVGNVLGTGTIVSGGKGAPVDDDKPRAGLYLVSGLPVVKNNIVALSERLVQGGESQKGGVFVASGTFAKNVTDNDTGLSDNWFVSVPPFKNAKRGNYRLKGADGIFVNTGDSSVWAGVVDPVDLDGMARIRDKAVDLGCYEKLVNGMAVIVR